MGASPNTPLPETQQSCRHHLVLRDSATARSYDVTHDVQQNMIRQTGSMENRNQNMIGFEYILIAADRHRLTI